MPPSPLYLPTIAPLTAEQAIHALIASGGEGPISGSVVHRPDREAAANLLEEAVREVLTEGWSFNTEHGLEITSTATIGWLGSDGSTATLNIFEPPPNLLSFKVTASREQECVDFIVRPPRDWLGGPLVFYDRILNRDGYEDRTSLFIDPTWLMDYEALPQTARNVVFHRAVRRFLAQVVGDLAASDRKERDELLAYRHLKKEFGAEDRFNLFGNLTTARHFGFRFFDQSTVDDRRGNRSGAVGGPGYRTPTTVDIAPPSFTLEAYELEEGPVVPSSIILRNTELSLRLSNPNSAVIAEVTVAPNPFDLVSNTPASAAFGISLQATEVNLLAPAGPETTVAEVTVAPNPFDLTSTEAQDPPASLLLLTNNLTLSAAATGFNLMVNFTNAVNQAAPGGTLTGTVTVNRNGGFAGTVVLSSIDTRITFPSGTTVLPTQTSMPFAYTVPANSGNGSFSGQIVGVSTGFPEAAAGYTVQVGTPSIDFSTGLASQNFAVGSVASAPFTVTRTNYTGPVTITANVPLNVLTFAQKQDLRDPPTTALLDITGNGAVVTGWSTGANGNTVFPANVSNSTIFFEVPTGYVGSSISVQVTVAASGATPVTKTLTFPINAGGAGSTNTVTTVDITPANFGLDATVALAQAGSIALGSASLSLTAP